MPLPQVPDHPQANHAHARSSIDDEHDRIKAKLANIRHKIGIHAGKGGVGKTFVACNVALLLQAEGYQVGLLDADIDCPNVHDFLNIKTQLETDDAGRLIPVNYKGLKIVSTGFIQAPGEAMIVRGPIKHRVLTDFLELTNWGPLDYLVIDFPPGTSDVPLSAMQLADLSGLIIVTTPQKEAIADARRAVHMARKLGVPLLGLLGNMEGEVFGVAAEALAHELAVPFLGSIPLLREIRELSQVAEPAFLEPVLDVVASSVLSHIPK